jgi:hypothetical protein
LTGIWWADLNYRQNTQNERRPFIPLLYRFA